MLVMRFVLLLLCTRYCRFWAVAEKELAATTDFPATETTEWLDEESSRRPFNVNSRARILLGIEDETPFLAGSSGGNALRASSAAGPGDDWTPIVWPTTRLPERRVTQISPVLTQAVRPTTAVPRRPLPIVVAAPARASIVGQLSTFIAPTTVRPVSIPTLTPPSMVQFDLEDAGILPVTTNNSSQPLPSTTLSSSSIIFPEDDSVDSESISVSPTKPLNQLPDVASPTVESPSESTTSERPSGVIMIISEEVDETTQLAEEDPTSESAIIVSMEDSVNIAPESDRRNTNLLPTEDAIEDTTVEGEAALEEGHLAESFPDKTSKNTDSIIFESSSPEPPVTPSAILPEKPPSTSLSISETSTASSISSTTTSKASTAPSIPSSAPSTPSSAPSIPTTAPSIPSSAPSIPSTAPSIPSTAPSIPSTAPSIPSSAPSTPTTAPSIPSTAPSIPSTAPSIPSTAPSVALTPSTEPVVIAVTYPTTFSAGAATVPDTALQNSSLADYQLIPDVPTTLKPAEAVTPPKTIDTATEETGRGTMLTTIISVLTSTLTSTTMPKVTTPATATSTSEKTTTYPTPTIVTTTTRPTTITTSTTSTTKTTTSTVASNTIRTFIPDLADSPESSSDWAITEGSQSTTAMPDSNATVIAVTVSISVVLCLALLILLLFVIRRKRARAVQGTCQPARMDAYSMDNVSPSNTWQRGKLRSTLRASKRSYLNQAFEDPSAFSMQLTAAQLALYMEKPISNIEGEFSRIPNSSTVRIEELPVGVESKNRYANVLPIPETRVKIGLSEEQQSTPADDDLKHYINANYVRGPKEEPHYYIACQGPLESTVADFWQMIWENQSKIIIQLTDLSENGVTRCAEYLPPSEVLDCHRLYGDYQVTLKSRELRDNYVTSYIQLKRMEDNLVRDITHLWYSSWPVTGVPNQVRTIVTLLLEARKGQSKEQPGPIVLHCSPGTGRTGTALAIDICLRQLDSTRSIDIPRCVYRLRQDRSGCVQTKEQYAFIYKAVNYYASQLSNAALDSL